MANIIAFDTSRIDGLIDKHGLKQTWINLLATKVLTGGETFAYILNDALFAKAKPLPEDLLAGLSIGEIGVIYEYCVAYVDRNSRKDNGQFFTPDDVAEFMAAQASGFPKGRWLDPCSGIGNLSWHLVNSQKDKESFLAKQLVLSDKDGLALLIARVLFTLSFQQKRANLFNEIEGNFVAFDFLSVSDSGLATLLPDESLDSIPKHDFVIVNPPYLGLKAEDSRFQTAKAKDLYAYFLENIAKTSKGFISVTPQSFTNANKFQSLRSLLLETYSTLKIYAFDNIPGNIFYGVKFGSSNSNTANSIRAAITIALQSDEGYRITSLLRWRTSERQQMISKLDKFLSKPGLTPEFFPKVSSKFLSLYRQTKTMPRLGELLASRPSEFVLHIPAAPRYFISALKKPVSRASMRVLYFRNQEDLNQAYMLLNSSFMYWWWRVRDGGMTLSLETLHSLPVPTFATDKRLVTKLEKSETENVVYKKNAGALHENVKHDMNLIFKLTEVVAPEYSDRLILTHENSELVQL